VRDPVEGGRALRQLRRRRPPDLPPVVLLALADAEMRVGHVRTATNLFREARERSPGGPWAHWADIGLASASVMSGGSESRSELEEMAASDGPLSPTAAMVLAPMDARQGDLGGAGINFEQVAAANQASQNLREAARLGLAYVRYWESDLNRAMTAFTAVANANPGGQFADDARYGAAWVRVQRGDPDAVAALQEVADAYPAGDRRVALSRGAIELEPRSVLRTGFRRYRRSGIQLPEDVLAGVLDGDGGALARAALRRFETPQEETPPSEEVEAPDEAPRTAQRVERERTVAPQRRAPEPRPATLPPTEAPWMWRPVVGIPARRGPLRGLALVTHASPGAIGIQFRLTAQPTLAR
jgi:hypothetical protein